MSQSKDDSSKSKGSERSKEGPWPNPFDTIKAQRAAALEAQKEQSGPPDTIKDPSWNEYLKVVRWEASQTTSLQTIQAPGASEAHFFEKYLVSDIETLLKDQIKFKFSICLQDGSLVPQSMHISSYMKATLPIPNTKEKAEHKSDQSLKGTTQNQAEVDKKVSKPEGEGPSKTKAEKVDNVQPPAENAIPPERILKVFIKEEEGPFSRLPFRLRFVKKGASDETRGSVESSAFDATNLAALTLAHLRRFATEMSARIDVHEFCLQDETPVQDATLLSSYLTNMKESDHKTLPIFNVYFRNSGKKSAWSEAPASVKPTQVKRDIDLKPEAWDKDRATLEGVRTKLKDPLARGIDTQVLEAAKAKAYTEKFLHASELDEQQWQTVIRNCSLMHGWIIDLDKMVVKPAPYAAFQLRKGLNMPDEKDCPLPPLGKAATQGNSTADVKPKAQNDAVDAPKAPTEKPVAVAPPASEKEPIVKPVQAAQVSARKTARELADSLPRKISAFPSFVMNDASKVTVSLITHELQESMAKNSFTSTSFEGEVSGGFKGVGLGVSGGASTTSQTGQAEAKSSAEKKLIADFKFARATVYLRAEDLEPTPALKTAIEKIKRTKNINDLRALHEGFGHFFCHEATVGGSLQTSRITSGDSKITESRQKEDFKAQVGLAASSPKGLAGSMKASRQKSTEDVNGTEEHNVSDVQAFEATGGDALLASNPPEWCNSVRPYQNWRTIERSKMSLLSTALSQCADASLAHVKEWFLEAVPHLSEYLTVPQSRVLDVRLKVVADIPGLTDIYDTSTFRKKSICNYLGHQFGKAVHPVRMGMTRRKSVTDEKIVKSEKSFGVTVNDLTQTYKQFDVQSQVALFAPAQFQAPVLLQYEDPNRRIEMLDIQEYQETVWQLVVPTGEHLKDGSLVALRSYHKNANVYLTVFRNAQGSYLPAMSDSGDIPFWRIKKFDSAQKSSTGSYIREGDAIRFCWRFADQTCGFRDYQDDIYGRRRFTKPADAPAELYMKTPFPGFERADSRTVPKVSERASTVDTKTSLSTPPPAKDSKEKKTGETTAVQNVPKPVVQEKNGAAMIMSGDGDSKPILSMLEVVPHEDVWDNKIAYNLFDISFRVDTIGNHALGELTDYMTSGLDQTTSKIIEKEHNSVTKSWSAVDRQKTRDTYTEYGKQVAGHMLFGWGYTWLSKEFQPLSRALNL